MSRPIDADALYERTAKWEAQALHMVEVTVNDEDKTKWRKWSAVLAERSAFKHDIADAPTIESEQQWIPCSERMPEYDKPVLLSTAWGKTEIGFWTQRGWMIVACSYREFEQGAVAAWMPLPEPYAERRQDGAVRDL